MEVKKPVLLCILDGWGERKQSEYNAISLAKTPVWDRYLKEEKTSVMMTSGEYVGLPDGQMGNSEVGHMNIGAGRIVMQDLPRISKAAQAGEFDTNPAFNSLKQSNGVVHLFVLLSDGGVHSHVQHSIKAIEHLAKAGISVAVHAMLDGRDVPPKSAINFMKAFESEIAKYDNVYLASVVGRYFAMDRDNRWDRVSQAYDVAVSGKAQYAAASGVEAIEMAYLRDETDEFIKATLIADYKGMRDGDSIFFTSFRADRAREILRALLQDDFDGFSREKVVKFQAKVGMVEYSDDLAPLMEAMFFPEELEDIFGEVVAKAGLTQFRTAETEKYPHVTFFFNCGKEDAFDGEDRALISSPKVATYDMQPEMSAHEVCDEIVKAIASQKYDVIISNFANGDMVGHTGDLQAAEKAAEAVDICLGRIDEALREYDGVGLFTADHGNAEEMWDYEANCPHTAHTTNPVMAVLVNAPAEVTGMEDGKLGDIAPTLLELLNIEQPKAMTGKSLLKK